jgi:glucokinase
MRYNHDNRIVLTLDAGGTNFVFGAMQAEVEIIDPITIPARAETLEEVLRKIVTGFEQAKGKLDEAPVAISFAFPGPSDYNNGIIGDLQNLPTFRGGVALGPMLAEKFGIPTFINNDGDLFVYGEAIAGFLPEINRELEVAGSPKRFKNLFGITLGTGFGAGLVIDGQLFLGDNGSGASMWITRNKIYPESFAEESVSIRAVRRVYAEKVGIAFEESPEPKVICQIASGSAEGRVDAAREAWCQLGEAAGESVANAVNLVDALVVIGGGLSGAHELFLPAMIDEMNKPLNKLHGAPLCRMELQSFNLEDTEQKAAFLKGEAKMVLIPGSYRTIAYDPLKRTGVGISRLGTSKAVAIGAYTFALNELDKL